MKQVIGTFFTDRDEDFATLTKLFEDNGYEVARQGGANQAVVIVNEPEAPAEETQE